MDKYLDMPIKELINKYSGVAEILKEYKIGCVPCRVDSCITKDVVKIHNLSKEQEQEMMHSIKEIIYPDKKTKKGKLKLSGVLKSVAFDVVFDLDFGVA